MLIKLAGSLVWIFVGFAVSREINSYESKKLTQADAFITLINHIKLNIDSMAKSMTVGKRENEKKRLAKREEKQKKNEKKTRQEERREEN